MTTRYSKNRIAFLTLVVNACWMLSGLLVKYFLLPTVSFRRAAVVFVLVILCWEITKSVALRILAKGARSYE